MAKKIIQMYDKYQSTTKVYPKIIKECLQEDVTNYIEGQVVANPTLAGTEAELTGLQVGDTKYKIPEGTVVTANPTLAGTEADLESIEIGDTKYKVGGGKQLYRHCITILYATQYFISFDIINDREASYTDKWSDITAYMTAKGFNGWNYCLPASGRFAKSGDTKAIVNGLCMFASSPQIVNSSSGASDPNYSQDNMATPTACYDKVVAL